jgi:hypothetical protein
MCIYPSWNKLPSSHQAGCVFPWRVVSTPFSSQLRGTVCFSPVVHLLSAGQMDAARTGLYAHISE